MITSHYLHLLRLLLSIITVLKWYKILLSKLLIVDSNFLNSYFAKDEVLQKTAQVRQLLHNLVADVEQLRK